MPFPQRVWLLLSSLSPSKFPDEISSYADPGCLSQIQDPGSRFFPSQILDSGPKFFPSWIPDPGSEFFPSRILDPGSASKNLSILTEKKWFLSSQKYNPGFPPGSGSQIQILTFYPSRILILYPRYRIQGSKRHWSPDHRSQIRISNTGDFGLAQAVGGTVSYWLSAGAAAHSMDHLSEAFICKKEFSVYFIYTLSL